MLTCITCSKQRKEEDEEDSVRGTPNTKEAVKSLTSQFKDMALKVSGTSKQGKPSTPGSYRTTTRAYPDFDAISDAVSNAYMPGSTSSTPAWDFTRPGSAQNNSKNDPRFTGSFGGLESISARSRQVTVEDEHEAKEWIAQVEPGVHITFTSLPQGGNDLKRIRFSRDMFNKWQAQRWWGENYDRIMELYNVQRFNRQALDTPARSEDGRDSTYSKLGSVTESPMMTPSVNKDWAPRNFHRPLDHQTSGHQYNNAGSSAYAHVGVKSEMDASRMTTSSRDEASASASISNASDIESEWIEEDEPGIYITIRQLADGTRELRRVRFSREKFGEVHAKLWWEGNKDRIQAQYL